MLDIAQSCNPPEVYHWAPGVCAGGDGDGPQAAGAAGPRAPVPDATVQLRGTRQAPDGAKCCTASGAGHAAQASGRHAHEGGASAQEEAAGSEGSAQA